MNATIEKSVICLCKSLIFCNFIPIKKHDMAQPETSVDQQQSFASEAEELAYLRQRVSMLEKENISLEKEKSGLLQQLDYWKKRFFGRMSEKRHLPLDPNQLSLFSAEELSQMTPEEKKNLEA